MRKAKPLLMRQSSIEIREALERLNYATAHDLVEETGKCKSAIDTVLFAMRAQRLVHIHSWECASSSKRPMYMLGAGEDAPKPVAPKKIQNAHVAFKNEPPVPFVPRPDVAAAWLTNQL